MKKSTSGLKFGIIAFIYSILSCQAVLADDVEVFFSGFQDSKATKPNILFIFDTSGSMSRNQTFTETQLDESGNPVEVTVSQSRMGILQDVMSDVLATQSGVNMGLARFSVPGGPILYPVTDPDEPADPIVLRSLSSADDDAIQVANNVSLDSDYLDPAINNGVIGLRFQNVTVPQGAKLSKASLVFSTDVDSLDPAEYQIYVQLVPNAPAFEASNKNLSDRISGLSVPWIAEPWDAEELLDAEGNEMPPTSFESPDISSLLQQVVDLGDGSLLDQDGWCGGNDLVILLVKIGAGSGRQIISHDKSADFSPKLRIDFDANIPAGKSGCYTNTFTRQVTSGSQDSEKNSRGTNNNSSDLDFYRDTYSRRNNTSVAISFTDINVPQGAKISDARLNFVSKSTSSGSAGVTIYAVNSANPPINTDVHSASNLTAGVDWSIESWDYGVPYSSVNIAGIVEQVIGLGDWSEGSNLSFVLKDGSSTRTAYSFDGSASRAPELEITFKGRYSESAATKRAAMTATVEDFKANGNTPISDIFAEAGLYYKGDSVEYGLVRGDPPGRDNRISHIDSIVPATGVVSTPAGCTEGNPSATACKYEKYLGTPVYNTPIKDACQSNNIVLLTDGEPTSHDRRTNEIYGRWTGGSCATNDRGMDCTEKMAGWLADENNDVIPLTPGKEHINTYTIGFYSDQEFLQDVADAGGGFYTTAYSKDELFEAIENIIGSILDVTTTFVSAGVTVNQYNRLTHNDELYFSLFSPSKETVWPGNLKRYRLLDGELVDVNGASAVNSSGEFREDARSWWSADVDGNDVELGGAAEQMTNSRKVLSNLAVSNDLTITANRVDASNSLITEAMVSASDAADREKILDWVTGEDVNNSEDPTAARQTMGDPLHSQPTLLIYRTGASEFRTSVYVGTNEGFLHSIDTESGRENWAFIPKDLLPRLSEVQKDTLGPHSYGIDGSVTLYVEDKDGAGSYPGVVDPGEKAYLYIGMRRGGTSYYALDITNPDSPEMLFKIDPSLAGFEGMGQTWSKPVVKKMKFDGNDKTVIIFGGGYDTTQDTAATAYQNDSVGKDVYIIDAFSGELLWQASKDAVDVSASTEAGSLSSMQAVPNEITAFDFDGDEYIDHFYASDTKAQVFRFDIDYATGKISGGRVAHLQDGASASENRRFYNSPDLALIRLNDRAGGSFVSISIGSGYRAHPLDETVTDHFYMVKDKGILNGEFDMDASLDSLADVTSLIGDGNGDGISDAAEVINTEDKNGWFISFSRSGEKTLSDSVTFNNVVLFTSYTPPSVEDGSCSAVAGTSRLYAMRVTDGNPYLDSNFDGQLSEVDRETVLQTSGIAPPPQIIIDRLTGKPTLLVGSESLKDILPNPPKGLIGRSWEVEKK